MAGAYSTRCAAGGPPSIGPWAAAATAVQWSGRNTGVAIEPVTWRLTELTVEWKGTAITKRMVTKAICGFANLDRVGYLVLGVSKDATGRWQLGNWVPEDEPNVWISNLVGDTLDPRPRFDVEPFTMADGSRAAVVRVLPVAIPPCITNLGEVFERLPGKTQPVRDSATLRQLIGRGEIARSRAENEARNGRNDLGVLTPPNSPARHLSVVVSASLPSFAADLGGAIHDPRLVDAIEARLRSEEFKTFIGNATMEIRREYDQYAVTIRNQDWHDFDGYVVRLRRQGSISAGVVWGAYDIPGVAGIEIVARLWDVVVEVAEKLVGRLEDPACFAIRVGRTPAVEMYRWSVIAASTDEMRADLTRELKWGLGETA